MQEELLVAPCSLEAAKYACIHYHYICKMAGGKTVKHGVWENGEFIGAIVYGTSATPHSGNPYDLNQYQICELRRVALTNHKNTVSKIVSKSLKLLHKENPGIVLVVSYADPYHNHVGTIYQAMNWIYEGKKKI